MFWQKKPAIKPVPKKIENEKKELIKPSPRRRVPRAKRIEFHLPCYLLVDATNYLVHSTTVNISRTGLLVKSMYPLETGQEVLCLLTDKKNLKSAHVRANQNTLKGKIVRVEKELMLYKLAIQITLGRINPVAHLGTSGDEQFWWSRFWQSMDMTE
jgi:hypothetical protein